MTETQWTACVNPDRLIDYHVMKKDPRRLRLLAAACVRLVVTPATPVIAEEVLDVVERYSDGAATRAELLAARKAARKAIREKTKDTAVLSLGHLTDDVMEALTLTIANTRRRNGAAQCGLVRCLYGNPYKPAKMEPDWLTTTPVALARAIYVERAFDRLPILADALEEAGCEDPDILGHCRNDGAPHARGCWVVDAVLGKR